MIMRAYDKDHPWTLVAMNDCVHRRGIWYRTTKGKLEICAGREGDDCYLSVSVGEEFTEAKMIELRNILATGAWMVEENYQDPEESKLVQAVEKQFGEEVKITEYTKRDGVLKIKIHGQWYHATETEESYIFDLVRT